jgi:hypothetical protein
MLSRWRRAWRALESLPAPALQLEWARVYGTPAPRRIGRDLLPRAIAYRIQKQGEAEVGASSSYI